MDRARRRCNSFLASVLILWACHRDRDQRRARLRQLATFECASPSKHLVRVHTVSSRYFSHADARL